MAEDARFCRKGCGAVDQGDPRLHDVTRNLHLELDAVPLSGRVPSRERYCALPERAAARREGDLPEPLSSWTWFVGETDRTPFPVPVFGRPVRASVSAWTDPQGKRRTEKTLLEMAADEAPASFGLCDLAEEAAHRLHLQSLLQSQLDARKFVPGKMAEADDGNTARSLGFETAAPAWLTPSRNEGKRK